MQPIPLILPIFPLADVYKRQQCGQCYRGCQAGETAGAPQTAGQRQKKPPLLVLTQRHRPVKPCGEHDVYKRQAFIYPLFIATLESFFIFHLRLILAEMQITVIVYTHLDVYKRQV